MTTLNEFDLRRVDMARIEREARRLRAEATTAWMRSLRSAIVGLFTTRPRSAVQAKA